MLRERLRTETSSYHNRIEQKLALTERVRNHSDYATLLERFYGFYIPVERKLAAFADEFRTDFLGLSPRFKSGWLAEDLAKFGYFAEQLLAVPICSEIPSLMTYESAVGCLYVLEGSTLGAQIIARHFNRTLSITRECGGRFFYGYGGKTGEMWQSFLTFLKSVEVKMDSDVVVRAACDTFNCLEKWLLQQPLLRVI